MHNKMSHFIFTAAMVTAITSCISGGMYDHFNQVTAFAETKSATEIINEITNNSDDDLTNNETYISTTGIHYINNLCQDSDYKLTEDKLESIKSSINPSSKSAETFTTSNPIQNLSNTDATTSYLISNDILSRKENFSLKNGELTFSTERVMLEGVTAEDTTGTNYTSSTKVFKKSDLYMALYKSIYGVIDSRTLVFNIPSMRTVDGSNKVVSEIVNYNGNEGTASFTEGDYYAYVSPNVYELYLSKLLDKGFIDKSELINDKNHTFISDYNKLATKSIKPTWYNDQSVAYADTDAKAFGSSFKYSKDCILNSKNFNYFKDEEIDIMEAFSIIEDFMRLTEKNMTNTEANIISYKYGASSLNQLASANRNTVSFLIAKGILNFEDEDFPNYFSTFETDTAYTLIYRFSNKDYRYDFSKVTLTDEESYWMEKGFAENDIDLYRTESVPSVVTLESGITYRDIVESDDEELDDTINNDSEDDWETIGSVSKFFNSLFLNSPLAPDTAYALKSTTYGNYKVVKLFDTTFKYSYDGVSLEQLTETTKDIEKIEKTDKYYKITFLVRARNSEDAVSAVDGNISCEITKKKSTIPCFTSISSDEGEISLISKKSIESLFPEISCMHDKLLVNVDTGCEALLMGDSGYAIVGSKVIVSDDLIVHDAGDDVYYNLKIITSLLTNADLKELDNKIGNQVTSLYISDNSLSETKYSVYDGDTLLNKTNVINLNINDKKTKFYNMDSMSRGTNTVSRTFPINDSTGREAFITVIVDLNYAVPSSSSFANEILSSYTLDSPLTVNNISKMYYTRPSDNEPDLQNWWDSNMGCSNALYNFIYGTHGVVYVECGYLAPSMTILKSNDKVTDTQVSEVFKDFEVYSINGVSYKKFFGDDLDKFWETYYNANGTGLTDLSKSLAREYRTFSSLIGEKLTDGTSFTDKYFVTNADTIYRKLENNSNMTVGDKRIDLNAVTEREDKNKIQEGDTLIYEFTDGSTKKTTKWLYGGIDSDSNYVLYPELDLMKPETTTADNNVSGWESSSVIEQKANSGTYTLSTLADDRTIREYLKKFYAAGFPDLYSSIDYNKYSFDNVSNLFRINAVTFGTNAFNEANGDQKYYLSGGYVYERSIETSADGTIKNALAKVTTVDDIMNVAAVPVALIPTGKISISSISSNGTITYKATAGCKMEALHMGGVYLQNTNQSIIDYAVYNDIGAKSVNSLNEGDTIYIGSTLYCKKDGLFVSSPIKNDTMVAAAKESDKISPKQVFVSAVMGQKVYVNGTEHNLSDYVTSADTGSLYNAGEGKNGVVYKEGNIIKVWKDNKVQNSDVSAVKVCISLGLDDALYCRPVNKENNCYVLMYSCGSLGTNSLGNLPFMNESLDYERFNNIDVTLNLSKFNLSQYGNAKKKEFLSNFKKDFFKDLRSLIYNIVLAFCYYLLVMTWLVYGVLRYNVGRHFLEMIANPTRLQSFKGIDLIKVFTLGIFNLNSECTLSRFFTTSIIDVIIIYIVAFVLPH